ncbi:MAG TPA: EamA family transporter [Candidatus Limnocylindrales bacterium]
MNPALIAAGLLILYVVWGSTYLGIAIAIDTIPPMTMAAIRFLVAGSVLVALVAIRRPAELRRPTLAEIRDSVVIGILLAAVGNGFVTLGEQTVPSGIAALFIALVPVWLAVLGRLVFRDRLPRLVVAGILIGFAGVGLLAWPGVGVASGGLEPVGLALVLVAPIGWSSGSLFAARRALQPRPALLATGIQMLGGGTILAILAIVTGEAGRFDPAAVSAESLAALVYLTTVGSLLGYSTYAWLLSVAPVSLIATYAYVNPVVAVALGALVLQEPVTPRTLVAGAIIVIAVALIVTARGRVMRADRSRGTANEPRSAAATATPQSAATSTAARSTTC